MALSLDPSENPILRLYQLFDQPGVVTEDGPYSLGVENLRLKDFGSEQSRELVQFLSQTASSALDSCRLALDGQPVVNFAAHSAAEMIEQSVIDDLVGQGSLNQDCLAILSEWKDLLDQYGDESIWPPDGNPFADYPEVLDELAAYEDANHPFALEIGVDKVGLANEYLRDGPPESSRDVSILVWHSLKSMQRGFDDFQALLEYAAQAAGRPVIAFFYDESVEPYLGDFFKALSLAHGEATLTLVPQLLAEYAELRIRHKHEKRSNVGQRFDLPPALFLRQNGHLPAYPTHPLFLDGPVRSLLVYALLAWLAEYTEPKGSETCFTLPSSQQVTLTFSSTDVRQGDASIFETEADWQNTLLLLTHDVHRSTGNESLRTLWGEVLKERPAADFTAAKLLATLNAIRSDFIHLERELAKSNIQQSSLRLRVFLDRDVDGSQLKFELDFPPLGFFYKPVGNTQVDPSNPALRLHDLNEMARDHLTRVLEPDVNDPRVLRPDVKKLKTRGYELWDRVIPKELKQDYVQSLREKDLTMLVVSDNPSFPWELVKPYGDLGGDETQMFDDLWWALKFNLARWLAGHHPPATEIELGRICCVATTSHLASVSAELDYLQGLGVTLDKPATQEELFELLSTQDYGLLHFACHGEFDTDQPGESVVQLPDHTLLRPADLYDPQIRLKFRANRPLVFLNACHSGRTGPTLTGIGGWAERFIDLRCGAFIGCGWEVSDSLAAKFAIAFYKSLKGGETLAQAVRSARQEIRDGANSTWLAYYLYGDPHCRLK